MPAKGLVHKGLKLWFLAKTLQQRITCKVGITKKSTPNTMTQHVKGRRLVPQHGIGLGNFVNTLRVGLDSELRLPGEAV